MQDDQIRIKIWKILNNDQKLDIDEFEVKHLHMEVTFTNGNQFA